MNSNRTLRRPHSIAEVAEWAESFRDFSYHVTDFLHHFKEHPDPWFLSEEPSLLATRFPEGRIADAFLAATAATLADSIGQPRPRWTTLPQRYLSEPWFASPGRHLRATLLLESPPAFRERNLFVTANALSVA